MKVSAKTYWSVLSKYLSGQRALFITLSILLFGSIGLQLVIPQITRQFIDAAKAASPDRILLTTAIGFIAASLIQQIVSVLARFVGENVAWTATNEMRIDLAKHCLELDMSFHNDKSPGQLIERIDGDILQISQFFSQLVVMVIGSLLLLIGIITVLFFEDVRIGAMFAGFSSITLFAFIKLRNIAVPHDKANREALTELFGFIEERLAGTEDIRASGAVDFVLRGLYQLHYKINRLWKKAEMMHTTIRLLAGLMMSVGFGVAFVAGYTLYNNGTLTIGTVYLVIQYTQMINRPIRILSHQMEQLQNIGANIQRVTELLSVENKIKDPAKRLSGDELASIGKGPHSVSFDHVSFSYVEDETVLNDLSFSLSPGEVLGLLGRTGSGKTTLARLIFRLYDPEQGHVSVGGRDVKEFGLSYLRNQVAMVTQDVQLFQATVRENLTFFDQSIPDERLISAIENLGLGHWLEGLPLGLDTRLETGGKGLSAGEAQLLAFTRIFLRDPGLIILDEASSRVDPATEKLMEHVVDKLLESRTAIVIAHRLGTVMRADKILIMSDGRAKEFGDRKALMDQEDSMFRGLLSTGLEEVMA